MATGFNSSKLKVVIEDGFEFMKQSIDMFDVIINDTSDPEGKYENLKCNVFIFK